MSILIFFVVLGILVIVHEYGHFSMAKAVGVKVERFAVGFGPKLFSCMHKDTEFMVCLIPLGGYVKMSGDDRANCQGRPEEYFSKPAGHRALIVLMGPVVNYLLAYICLYFVYVMGYPTLSPKIGNFLKGYPAQIAGLQIGDKILSINGEAVESWEDVQSHIAASASSVLDIKFLRENETLTKMIQTRQEMMKNIFGQEQKTNVIGISPEKEMIMLRFGLLESFEKALSRLWNITAVTYQAIYRLMTGAMSAKESMAGPIGMFYIVKEAANMGFSYLLYVVGIISASLAIFNLLPVPVLDGGHLLLLGIERMRNRPLPQKVDDAITKVGFSLILCLAVFVFYNDFEKLGWIDKIFGLWKR